MNQNEQKQQLSIAYLHAVASAAGFALHGPAVDDDSVDRTVVARGWVHRKSVLPSPKIDVQLKSVSRGSFKTAEDSFVFRLSKKNYDETAMNPTLRLPKDRVLTLDPADIEAYLLARGWEVDQRASSANAGVYRLPADPIAEIPLPRDRRLVDYALRVSEVLQALAAVEKRTTWEVLEDFLARRQGSSANGPAPAQGGAVARKRRRS